MRPISHFTELWRLDDPAILVDADSTHVVVQRLVDGAYQLAVHDVHDGREIGRVRGFPARVAARGASPALLDHETLLVVLAGELVAHDLPTLRERWRVPAVPRFDIVGRERAVAGRVLMQSTGGSLLLRDLATGRELWRRATPSPLGTVSVLDADRVYFQDREHRIFALAPADGREQWQQPPVGEWAAEQWQLVLVGDAVAVVGPDVVRFDRATGRQLSRYPADGHPGGWHAVAAAGDTLYISSSRGTAARDIATGELRWLAPVELAALEVGDDALTGCGAGGVVHVLDRTTGAESWQIGLGRCQERWPHDQRWARVATGTRHGDILVTRTANALVAHARTGDVAAPAEDATIRGTTTINGRNRGDVEVHVGDRIVRSDAGGNYSVSLPAVRGVVRVEVTGDEAKRLSRKPCGVDDEPTLVPLTGAGTYDVTAAGRAHDYECDEACLCD